MKEIDFDSLQAGFGEDELEWRLQQAGEKNGRIWAICVPYIDNRAIQQRLDEVCGPAGWRNEYAKGPEGGVLCGISIRIGDEWVTKWDGAENTDIEGVKGGLSAAMKRAAVQWGIGRYLYGLDETFARVSDRGKLRGRTKQGKEFRWDPPRLPAAPLRRSSENGEHEAMLQFVRRTAPQVGDDAEIRIEQGVVRLKDFVRDHWAAIKEQPLVARTVVAAIEQATGSQMTVRAA